MENYIDILLKLTLSLVFGGLLGVERSIFRKRAGMRTYALVSMGSCLFVLISEQVGLRQIALGGGYDALRMASQVVAGVGFLGAGLIIFRGNRLQGLTTAAGLWVSAGVGIATGYGLYFMAFIASAFTLATFSLMWSLETRIAESLPIHDKNEDQDEPTSPSDQ